ncbi:uncharacterized protein K452DRAFT_288317 [Aplosporella prunicola CBS 121167]|uniref:Rhodopsin domain-containing protein n=1 Tax=Aplosporella prunicola CBS 121167 TaxID=1176127 RepID=A0A6A6B9M7_9PEZI|nr:uncharacterized protein K452DRAFT_288317 [Aplosporella prunicola CBS 121167]KAF2140909.1 hypothetical protein K452DRAFT_288317 [Aplosporella prunicola CBS 121167]
MVRNIPISVLLSFPAPNYVDPVTRGPSLVVVNAIFIALVNVIVLARLYTRIFIKRWFGSDDVFIILAFITAIGLTVNVIIANTSCYWDRHIWDIPISSIESVLKVAFSAKLIFVFAATFTRQSLLCFYYRLVQDSGITWFLWAIHATVVINVITCIVFTAIGIWQCAPVSAYWDIPTPVGGHCWDEGPVTLIIGVVNCFTDLLVTLLPVPVIMKLQMPIRQRLDVMLLLSLGFAVIIAGIVRTYFIWKGLMDSYDETWFTYPLWIAAAVEIDLGVICACAPALRPLTARYVGPMLNDVSSKLNSRLTSLIDTRLSSRMSSNGTPRACSKAERHVSRGSGSTLCPPNRFGSKLASKLAGSNYKSGTLSHTQELCPGTPNVDADDLSFITYPEHLNPHLHGRSSSSGSLGSRSGGEKETSMPRPTTLPVFAAPATAQHAPCRPSPPASPLSAFNQTPPLPLPLAITCRQSVELAHLDSATAAAAAAAVSRRTGGRRGAGGARERINLDPRMRCGSPLGSWTVVGSQGGGESGGGAGKEGGRRASLVRAGGWWF